MRTSDDIETVLIQNADDNVTLCFVTFNDKSEAKLENTAKKQY